MSPIHIAILMKSQVDKYRKALASGSLVEQEQALATIQQHAIDSLRELRQTKPEKYSSEVVRRAQM